MSEVLYIRLNSHADAPIWWLIWSNVEREIIASGELLSAEQLSTLSDKADHRKVVVIVPSQDVTLKSVNVPGKSSRAHKAVVPYMLEDELTEDVDELFLPIATLKLLMKIIIVLSQWLNANCLEIGYSAYKLPILSVS